MNGDCPTCACDVESCEKVYSTEHLTAPAFGVAKANNVLDYSDTGSWAKAFGVKQLDRERARGSERKTWRQVLIYC